MKRQSQLVLLMSCLTACSSQPTEDTPAGTVRLFLDAMERANADANSDALEEAYRLLSGPSRRALWERAHLANALGARRFEPWEMLVQGHFRLNFTPAHGNAGMREHIEGEDATVVVTSQDRSRTAVVPLVRETGQWRIVLDIPPARSREGVTPSATPQ